MDLALSGFPLHTRLQTVAALRGEEGNVSVDARLLDVRKRGFVPVGADLQTSGIIHQMSLRAALDLDGGALTDVETAMAVPAFEPSPLTRGESCRDVAGRHAGLARLPLGDGAAAAVGAAMGSVRGCSHLLALTQLSASTMAYALPRAASWRDGPPRRLFQRTVLVDGAQPNRHTVEMLAQVSDLFLTEATGVVNPMDRFAAQNEVHLLVRIDLATASLGSLQVIERARDRDELASAPWRRRDDAVAGLVAAPLLGGFAKRVLAAFPDPAHDRPLVDALLSLAPTFIQVCGCFSDDWPSRCMSVDTLVGVGGVPDACYMWRRDGVLHSRKKTTDPIAEV